MKLRMPNAIHEPNPNKTTKEKRKEREAKGIMEEKKKGEKRKKKKRKDTVSGVVLSGGDGSVVGEDEAALLGLPGLALPTTERARHVMGIHPVW